MPGTRTAAPAGHLVPIVTAPTAYAACACACAVSACAAGAVVRAGRRAAARTVLAGTAEVAG